MPTLDTYQQAILSAQLIAANLCTANLNQIKVGNSDVSYNRIKLFQYYTVGLGFQLNQLDYTSSTTLTIYDRLSSLMGLDTTANVIDPSYQAPNTTIIVEGGGGTAKSEPIYFTNQTTVTITAYQNTYAPQFGNSPVLQIYVSNGDGTYSQDTGTTPTITYVGGIIANGINTITWSYGLPTSGFIIIMGVEE